MRTRARMGRRPMATTIDAGRVPFYCPGVIASWGTSLLAGSRSWKSALSGMPLAFLRRERLMCVGTPVPLRGPIFDGATAL
jgi:hypothetical protein